MSGNPWFRFIAGILASAVAIRLAVEIVRPAVSYILAAVALAAALVAVRWWRNRW